MADAIREGLSERKVERDKEGDDKDTVVKSKKAKVADDDDSADLDDEDLDDEDLDEEIDE
jgi:small subunit ribosomal protein S2